MTDGTTAPIKKARAKKTLPAATPAVPSIGGGPSFEIAKHDYQIERGDGVMNVQAGFYVVTDGDIISAMPPARFFEAYPGQAPAEAE